jgi:CheY-like chemotaxis protein/cytidylate kinase
MNSMTIITIDNVTFYPGSEVAEGVAARQGYTLTTDDDIFLCAAKSCGIPASELRRPVYGPAKLLDGIRDDRPKIAAALRVALAEVLGADNLVFHGRLSYLIPGAVTHVLKVGLVSARTYRLKQAGKEGLASREAEQIIKKGDQTRAEWADFILGREPWDAQLFDMVIPVDERSLDEIINHIVKYAGRPVVATTDEALDSLKRFQKAAELQQAFAEKGHDVDIEINDSGVEILIKKHNLFLDRLKRQLVDIAKSLPGVTTASARPGPRYREPSIYRDLHSELPRKVLLVDDEKVFVQTLSRRLRAREIDSSLAYGGAEALAKVEAETPEVMVLDLKMPGIDGIEVLRNVKANNPRTEVIILTAHGSDTEERLVFQLGAFACLHKPVDIDELTETMRRAYLKVRQNGDPKE